MIKMRPCCFEISDFLSFVNSFSLTSMMMLVWSIEVHIDDLQLSRFRIARPSVLMFVVPYSFPQGR